MPLHPVRVSRFANDCLEVQLQGNCRERDVFLIQPLVPPVQENLVELLLMLDAARGASAGRITVVLPHYAYARSDKKDAPRISIGGRLVADLLTSAGAHRVLAMTLHSPQVHGFFSVPVDHLHALRELADHFRRYDLSNTVVVSPDLGNAKEAAAFARMLGTPVAAGAKQRFADDRVIISAVIGEVADRDVIVLDDEIAKGSTVIELIDRLRERNVRVDPGGLHARPVLRRRVGAAQRAATGYEEIVCTNTVPIPQEKRVPQADGAVGRAGAGRGDAPDPQRRVGQRPVRVGRVWRILVVRGGVQVVIRQGGGLPGYRCCIRVKLQRRRAPAGPAAARQRSARYALAPGVPGQPWWGGPAPRDRADRLVRPAIRSGFEPEEELLAHRRRGGAGGLDERGPVGHARPADL